jgi:hypothetical protein
MSKGITFINDYKTKLIGLFSILVFLWVIIYAVPSIFISLFHTLLGNIILLISILLVGSIYSPFYGIGLAIIIIILYQISHPYPYLFKNGKENVKESFWSPQSINTFLKIQNTINPQSNFDTSVIQQQASQEEVDYFIAKGFWPWSKEVEDLFIEKTNKNTYIRSYPPDAMNHAKTIYNENAINQVLADKTLDRGIIINSTEPDLSGHGTFGYTSGLVTNETNPKSIIIRKNDKTGGLETIQFLGYGGIMGEQIKKITPFSI